MMLRGKDRLPKLLRLAGVVEGVAAWKEIAGCRREKGDRQFERLPIRMPPSEFRRCSELLRRAGVSCSYEKAYSQAVPERRFG